MSAPEVSVSSGDAGHAIADAGAVELPTPSDAVGLELVKLLAESQSSDLASPDLAPDVGAGIADAHAYDASDVGVADAHAYDGHVALALDMDVLPDIDSTLDMLTSSHQLFDVPALDVANVLDDSLPS
jgi:hypothetical protein